MSESILSEGFVRQYAIRLPNGSLYCRPKAAASYYMSIFGPLTQPEAQRELAIFNTRDEAEKLLDEMREHAAEVGVTNLGATIVQRLCSPFTTGDPAKEFASSIIEWLEQER